MTTFEASFVEMINEPVYLKEVGFVTPTNVKEKLVPTGRAVAVFIYKVGYTPLKVVPPIF